MMCLKSGTTSQTANMHKKPPKSPKPTSPLHLQFMKRLGGLVTSIFMNFELQDITTYLLNDFRKIGDPRESLKSPLQTMHIILLRISIINCSNQKTSNPIIHPFISHLKRIVYYLFIYLVHRVKANYLFIYLVHRVKANISPV
ncbi:hypothetical protein AMTRI_Chr07g79110 [Amborella trichopoda]